MGPVRTSRGREITKAWRAEPSLPIARSLFAGPGRLGRRARPSPPWWGADRAGAGGREVDQQHLAKTERRMVSVLDELELTSLVTPIHGISTVGAAATLAETGDRTGSPPPGQWSSTPAWHH